MIDIKDSDLPPLPTCDYEKYGKSIWFEETVRQAQREAVLMERKRQASLCDIVTQLPAANSNKNEDLTPLPRNINYDDYGNHYLYDFQVRQVQREAYETGRNSRKPLSSEHIDDLAREMVKSGKSVNWLARAIEAAHAIKD